jgi:hypothetical protein
MKHYHRCFRCSTLWSHTPTDCVFDPHAHNCPECGQEQYEICFPTVEEQEQVARREEE